VRHPRSPWSSGSIMRRHCRRPMTRPTRLWRQPNRGTRLGLLVRCPRARRRPVSQGLSQLGPELRCGQRREVAGRHTESAQSRPATRTTVRSVAPADPRRTGQPSRNCPPAATSALVS
jgi:hypothetical protein